MPACQVAIRNRTALLAALGIDNFGSGLFLPLSLVYVTRVVGLPLGTAGALVSVGTLAGLAAPALAGRLVDRVGPKPVVIAAQGLQALGAAAYLFAHAAPAVLVAAMLLAIGQQTFYSSLFSLISDVAGSGPRERPFAIANMVRSACFGLGGLVVAGVLTAAGTVAIRLAVAADAVSFVACGLLLAAFVRLPRAQASQHRAAGLGGRQSVLTDMPFLVLIMATFLAMTASDFFLVGAPVYLLELLHTRPWLPGAILAVETALTSTAGIAVLRLTRNWPRLGAMQLGAALYAIWCAAGLAAVVVPVGWWRTTELLLATVILAAATLVFGPRANAIAEAAAPTSIRGRYLAAFQYAFTVAGVAAPGIVALFSVAIWLPWVLVAGSAGLAVVGLRTLATRLPATALRADSAHEDDASIRSAA